VAHQRFKPAPGRVRAYPARSARRRFRIAVAVAAPALLAALVVAGSSAAADGERLAGHGYRALVQRASYGVPHITAKDFGGLGFGVGHVQADWWAESGARWRHISRGEELVDAQQVPQIGAPGQRLHPGAGLGRPRRFRASLGGQHQRPEVIDDVVEGVGTAVQLQRTEALEQAQLRRLGGGSRRADHCAGGVRVRALPPPEVPVDSRVLDPAVTPGPFLDPSQATCQLVRRPPRISVNCRGLQRNENML
jgi:hypothetical protein